MILFFSATGNCKYVAARLAQAADQEMLSIVDCIRENRYAFQDQTIGVISPTYDWGLPSIVKKFLEKASFQTDYLYFSHLWHNARRSRIHGQQSHTRLQNQCVLCCPDARYLDADL